MSKLSDIDQSILLIDDELSYLKNAFFVSGDVKGFKYKYSVMLLKQSLHFLQSDWDMLLEETKELI